MPTIHFILPDGSQESVTTPEGSTAMQAATGAGLPGIVGECGGSAMCATCHVYVDEASLSRLPPPLSNEEEMLDCTASERLPSSRLACQLRIDAGLDGLLLRMPLTQQ